MTFYLQTNNPNVLAFFSYEVVWRLFLPLRVLPPFQKESYMVFLKVYSKELLVYEMLLIIKIGECSMSCSFLDLKSEGVGLLPER